MESPREISPPTETRPRMTTRGSHSPCLRPKAKDVGMFISVAPSSNKQAQQQQFEQHPNTPEWLSGQASGGVTNSLSHNTVIGGMVMNRGSTVTSPTRRISAASSLQSRIAARRVSLNRQHIESRFGKARKNLSKTVHSMQLMHTDLSQQQTDRLLQSIATQTNESDESSNEIVGISAAEAASRYSRIPVPREVKLLNTRNKIPVPVCATRSSAVASGTAGKFALGNVYSLMTMSVSETKIEEIRSSSSISVSVRPVLEAHESCTVSDVNILRLGEVRSKEVDIDRTLENWKPTTAEVSLVSAEKPKAKSKKSIVKKDKTKSRSREASKERLKERSNDGSKERSKERTKEVKPRKEERQQPPPMKVPVIDLDKQAFHVPLIKSRSPSEKRSSRREQNNDLSTIRNEEKNTEKHLESSGSGSGSNFRVRFSPHLITPATSTVSSRGKFSNRVISPTHSSTSIPKYPELVRRVTDQAITSIAKSVILGLPPKTLSRFDQHPTSSFSSYHLPNPSPTLSGGNYRQSFQNYSRMPPMTMSSMNVHDDPISGYRLPSRTASQLSISSLMNYPSATGSLAGGLHSSGRYPFYSSRMMSSHSMPKSRKDFDNRYAFHHHLHHSNIWDSSPASQAPRNSWIRDSTSAYNMHSGEYETTTSGPPYWTRYQKTKGMKNNGSYTPTSSSSSLYAPLAPPKYDRPSQRFSLIRNHGGTRSSMDNLHSSIMSKKTMDTGSGHLHRPMSMDTGSGHLHIGGSHLHRPMSMETGSNILYRPMSTQTGSHHHRPMQSYMNDRHTTAPYTEITYM